MEIIRISVVGIAGVLLAVLLKLSIVGVLCYKGQNGHWMMMNWKP